MSDLSLKGISIPHKKLKGWQIGVSAGDVRYELVDGEKEDEDDDLEFLSLYAEAAQVLRKKPGVTVHIDSVTGRTVGIAENGDAFVADRMRAIPAGVWDKEKRTIIQALGAPALPAHKMRQQPAAAEEEDGA